MIKTSLKTICVHCIVSGHVQGVFYRKNTLEQAERHRVNGWVKNRSDGCVEVVLCGEPKPVAAMQAWLHEGPYRAKVSDVTTEEIACEHYTSFTIRN